MTQADIEILAEKFNAYELGEMTEEETIKFFQELVNSGMAWNLQGHYGRTAAQLIEQGLVVHPPFRSQNSETPEA